MKKISNIGSMDGMSHMAVPHGHVQSINSSFKQMHSATPMRQGSAYLPKAQPIKLKLPGMPGKNAGIKKGEL